MFFSNRKSWTTKEVWYLLREKNNTFKNGDKEKYNAASIERGKGEEKLAYKNLKIKECFNENTKWEGWRKIQDITNYRGKTHMKVNASTTLVEELKKDALKSHYHSIMWGLLLDPGSFKLSVQEHGGKKL